mmetsp:Transcript_1475/g.4780  ORF Transcript_1475/g.4780 Transcript_1475/m.4780 type:complete len:210 (-) Transcript_1475:261-890(-)
MAPPHSTRAKDGRAHPDSARDRVAVAECLQRLGKAHGLHLCARADHRPRHPVRPHRYSPQDPYETLQPPPPPPFSLPFFPAFIGVGPGTGREGAGRRTTRIASSNTFFSPSCVRALHSRYFTASIDLAIFDASSEVIGSCPFSRSTFIVATSFLRSLFVPTRMMGTPGQWCLISGAHFCFTFSNEAREMREKATRKTSVSGYDSGLKRS